jgi:hypothetical protein
MLTQVRRRTNEIVFTTKYWGPNPEAMYSLSAANCQTPPANGGVAFVFGSGPGLDDHPKVWCEYALGQLGSDLAGLDHSRDCHDYLGTFQTACGDKTYVDGDLKCGENTDRTCFCGGTTQNSYQKMRAALCH